MIWIFWVFDIFLRFFPKIELWLQYSFLYDMFVMFILMWLNFPLYILRHVWIRPWMMFALTAEGRCVNQNWIYFVSFTYFDTKLKYFTKLFLSREATAVESLHIMSSGISIPCSEIHFTSSSCLRLKFSSTSVSWEWLWFFWTFFFLDFNQGTPHPCIEVCFRIRSTTGSSRPINPSIRFNWGGSVKLRNLLKHLLYHLMAAKVCFNQLLLCFKFYISDQWYRWLTKTKG